MQRAVTVVGLTVESTELSQQEALSLECNCSSLGWLPCFIPMMLGIPLAMRRRIPPSRTSKAPTESLAMTLLADPNTGLVPVWVQKRGLGHVLVARMDGEDFTQPDLLELHAYICHLISMSAMWAGVTPDNTARQAALAPEAFALYKAQRQAENGG